MRVASSSRLAALLLAGALLSDYAAQAAADEARAAAQPGARQTQARQAGAHAVRTANLWQRIRRGFAIPDLYGLAVYESESRYAGNPAAMAATLERGRPYLHYIVEEIQKRGMPMEIALLPMVESSFNPLAYSRARASGLWQFVPATGRRYRLTQTWWFDARRDVIASTEAALDYLDALYRMHGDWHLALAAYNCGENTVARAIEQNRSAGLGTDYASLPLPEETRRYVPKLQALKNILRKPAQFGVELPKIPNTRHFVALPLERDIDLRLAAELAEMPLEELVQLNPGHNRPVTDPSATPRLILPANRAGIFASNLDRHEAPLSAWTVYTVRPGDRVARIAAAHGISVRALRRVNSLPARAALRPGDQLLVPAGEPASAAELLPAALHPLLDAAERESPSM